MQLKNNETLNQNGVAVSSRLGLVKSRVGIHPMEWEIKRIDEIASVRTGPFGSLLHQDDYVNDGTPIITVEHLGDRGIIHENLPMVSDKDKQRLNAYLLRKHDIVFSRVGSVDRNSLVKEDEEGWLFSGRLLRIRLANNDVYSPFLSYYFSSEPFKNRIRKVAVGQTMASLNTKIMNNIEVVLPPSYEQHAIAEVLSDVDSLIEAQEALIAKKRLIKQGVMQELLTGKRRLSGFYGEWKKDNIGNFAKIEKGRIITEDSSGDGVIPVIGGGKEPSYYHNTPNRPEKTITISASGAYAGYVAYHDNPIYASDCVTIEENEHFNIKYLFQLLKLQQNEIYSLQSGGAQPHVYSSNIEEIEVLLPSIDEQKEIANIIFDFENEIRLLEKKLDKIRSIKQGMMQELLTGRTRLV